MTLTVERHHPASFLARARAFLERREADHNLLLGLAESLGEGALTLSAPPVLATVARGGDVVLAALRTPPRSLVISAADDDMADAAVDALVDALQQSGVGLPGVTGPTATADRFAARWAGDARLHMQMRLYGCRQVVPVPAAPGVLRAPREEDRALLVRWLDAFGDDIREPTSPHEAERQVERRFRDGSLYLWDDGGVVSLAGVAHPAGRTIRVNAVYTPPEQRGRGYATSCVAEVTRRMLGERSMCVLYTDLANPTSNAIYQRLGYQPLSDCAMWHFSNG